MHVLDFTIFAVVFYLRLAKGCHISTVAGGEGIELFILGKNTNNECEHDVSFQEPLSECLLAVTDVPWDWKSVLSFVLKYTKWYKNTSSALCDKMSKKPTSERDFLISRLKFFIKKKSPVLSPIIYCIDYVTIHELMSRKMKITYFNKIKKTVISAEESVLAQSSGCDNVDMQSYELCLRDEIMSKYGEIIDFHSVFLFFHGQVVSRNSVKSTDTCWYQKFENSILASQLLHLPLKKCFEKVEVSD